jgi:hypothetical protein
MIAKAVQGRLMACAAEQCWGLQLLHVQHGCKLWLHRGWVLDRDEGYCKWMAGGVGFIGAEVAGGR